MFIIVETLISSSKHSLPHRKW